MVGTAKEIYSKKIIFSPEALEEIELISKAVREIIGITIDTVENTSKEYAIRIEPLEQVIDNLKYKMKSNHVDRLQNNKCTIELGFVYSDIINNLERIADHCSNIGVTILQNDVNGFEPHYYLSHVKSDGDNDFRNQYEYYKKKYNVE